MTSLLAGTIGLRAAPLGAQESLPVPSKVPTAAAAPEPRSSAGVEPTRLFFAPTARSVTRGDGSFGVTEAVFPWAEVGLADRLSIRTIVVPPLGDLAGAGIVLGGKLQLLRHRHVQVAVGLFQSFARSGDSGGAAYGVVTIGSRDTSATVGLGQGYGEWVDSEGSSAVVFVGAERALGRRVRLIVEGYIGGAAFGLPDQTLIAGTRLNFGRWSLDLGVAIPFYETGSGTPGPVVTIGRAF